MINRSNKILLVLLTALFIFNLSQSSTFSQEIKALTSIYESPKPEYVTDEIIVKFKPYVPENNISISSYREERDVLLKAQLSSDSIEALKKKYEIVEVGKVFTEPEFINLNNKDSDITKALNKAFPCFEEKFKGNSYSQISKLDLSTIHKFKLQKGSDVPAAAFEFSQDSNVEYAEPNYICKVEMVPNDPYYNARGSWGQSYDDLWGLKKIQCEQAWDISRGEGAVVAVIDTGVDYNHEDIAGNIFINKAEIPGNGIDDDRNGYIDDYRGYDFVNLDNDPMDDHGHGTHVGGIVAAAGNNNIGIIGVAPKAKVMALKGFDSTGLGQITALASCLKYAADNGGHVINNSWGGYGESRLIEDAVNYAYSKGCTIVAAAGNNNNYINYFFPANNPCVIAVSSTDHDDQKSDFSNWGTKISVAAPGGESGFKWPTDGSVDISKASIVSLRANNSDMFKGRKGYAPGDAFYPVQGGPDSKYYRALGTSMACPHVSGLAALIRSLHPEFTNAQIRARICSTSIDLGAPGKDDYYGYGRVDAYRALQANKPITLPFAYISSPKSLQILKGASIDIKGTAASEPDYFQDYSLFYSIQYFGSYDNPPNRAQIPSASMKPVNDGLLGSWDINALNDGYYFLKLTVNSTNPLYPDQFLTETDQKLVHIGNMIKDGWPVNMDYRMPSSPAIADLDNDGKQEIVVLDGNTVSDGKTNLYVIHHDGRIASEWGWPRDIGGGPFSGRSAPAIADLDKDSDNGLEIVIGNKFAFHYNGVPVTGWPNPLFKDLDNSEAAVLLYDIDADGGLEAIVPAYGKMYALRADGTVYWSRSIASAYTTGLSACVADLNGDGKKEIAYLDPSYSVYLWDYQGNLLSGWPKAIDARTEGVSSVAAGDINNDNLPELIAVSFDGFIYAWRFDTDKKDFVLLPGWGIKLLPSEEQFMAKSVALADILKENGTPGRDGKLELIMGVAVFHGTNYSTYFTGKVYVIDGNGKVMPGWPQDTGYIDNPWGQLIGSGGIYYGSCIAGDIDDDSYQEVIAGTQDRKIYAWHADGKPVSGFPMDLGNRITSTPCIGDIDGDNKIELIVNASDVDIDSGWGVDYPQVYSIALKGKYNASNIDWPMFQHDPQHTGAYAREVDITPPPAPIVTDEGRFTRNKDRLYASWACFDPGSGIDEYQYKVTSLSGNPKVIRDWTSTGKNNYVNAAGLKLKDGETYYFDVKARNGIDLWSQIGSSDGIIVDTIAPAVTNKTSNSQKVNEPLIFKAQALDIVSGVKSVYLETYSMPGYRIRNYLIMEYNPATGFYQANLSPEKSSGIIPYKIYSQDNAGNTSKTGFFYLTITNQQVFKINGIVYGFDRKTRKYQPLSGALVRLYESKGTRTTYSSDKGYYSFEVNAPGFYQVSVNKPGYGYRLQGVMVKEKKDYTLDFYLFPWFSYGR